MQASASPLLTLSSTNAARAAAHAERLGLPRISPENAAAYPPPSLNAFRKPESRQPDDAKPALWYWQMTGCDWDRAGHSYELEKKRHRRMLAEHKQSEKQREAQRDRSKRERPEDESEQRYQRYVKQREREWAEADDEVRHERECSLKCERERRALLGQLMDKAGIGLPLDERTALIERLILDMYMKDNEKVERDFWPENPMVNWIDSVIFRLGCYADFLLWKARQLSHSTGEDFRPADVQCDDLPERMEDYRRDVLDPVHVKVRALSETQTENVASDVAHRRTRSRLSLDDAEDLIDVLQAWLDENLGEADVLDTLPIADPAEELGPVCLARRPASDSRWRNPSSRRCDCDYGLECQAAAAREREDRARRAASQLNIADAKLGLNRRLIECTRNLLGESHPDLIPRLLREGVPASVLASTVPYLSKAAIAAAVKAELEAKRDRERKAEVQQVLNRILADVEWRAAKLRPCVWGPGDPTWYCGCAKCDRRELRDMYGE